MKWHDGKPFSAADVKCTWDALIGKADEKSDLIRKNPRKIWYSNLKDVTTNGPTPRSPSCSAGRSRRSCRCWPAATRRSIPASANGRDMRSKPIGTGPFKVVDFKRNESIKLVRNPDYWKKGRPYLDAIDWKIVPNRSTRMLGFVAGEFDMTFDSDVTFPLLKDVKAQKPDAVCEARPTNVSANLLVNRDTPPFDKPELRRAMVLAIDRKAVQRHPVRGPRPDGRRHAAAAGRPLGHAQGDAGDPAGLSAPTSRRTGPRRARSWRSSATARTSRSRSRSRRATSRSIATRR